MADVKISQLTHIPSITDADVMLISDIETLVSYKMDLSNLASYTSTALSSGSNLDTLFAGIKTVDGSGSGLDADLLDGQNGSYYLDWNNATNKPDPVLTLNGDVSGTATFTNLANATLTVTVSDDSHNHVIANVDGLQSALDSKASLASPTFTGVPTAPTATAGTSNTQLATTAFVSTAVSNLVDTAPSTLDTLNELAAALGDNPNFATTVTNSLATKLPLAGGEMTGNITFSSTQTVDGRDLSVDGSKLDGIESGATADQTAAEILTAIKTVDGSGSGLDADLWDGNQFASYLNQAVLTTSSPTFSGLTLNGSGGTLTTLFSAADGTTKEDFLGGFVSEDRAFRMLSERQGGSRYYWFTFNQDYDGTTHTQGNWGGSSAIKFAGSTTQFFADYQVTGGSQDSISPTLSMSILPTGVEIENDLSIGGNISVTGTVDGRDIATDGSKLDGIESGATADQTAAEILTAIKTVDGSGSGLDADLLDGIHASSLLRSDVSDQAAVIEFQGGVTYTPPAGSGSDTATDVGIALTSGNRLVGAYNGYIRNLLEWNSSNDIVIGQASTALITGINLLPGGSGDAKVNGNKIWHAGNDGSGSGLDADLWDGNQFSSYLNQALLTTSSPTFAQMTTGDLTVDNIVLASGADRTITGPSSNNLDIVSYGATRLGFTDLYTTLLGAADDTGGVAIYGGGAYNTGAGYVVYGESHPSKAGEIWMYTSGFTSTMVIDSDGNVGIGTSSPSEKLSVSGNISVTGTVDGRDVAADGTKLDGIESGATADQTASEILTAIKTVDGSGSGLDADTVDGLQASSFVRKDNINNGTVTIKVNDADFIVADATDGVTNFIWRDHDVSKLYLGTSAAVPTTRADMVTSAGDSYWHAGNDGSGSGLDADLWDGNQFADYLDQSVKTTSNPTWPSATLTGVLTLGNSITHQGDADTSIGFTTNQIVLQAGGVDALTANSTQLLSPLPLTVGNGTDQDYDLIVTNSTKGAKLYWDESETKIATNWGFYVAGDVRFNSYATIKTSLGVGTAVNIPPTEALEVAGNISVTGTVDGRDIATDGSKLDGIEAGATADQTASEILTAIKTVDGSGSGLDADTVDGIQASSFLRSDANDTTSGNITIRRTDPNLILEETDTTTSARLVIAGGNFYIQGGAAGAGGTTSSGNIRITGYNADNVNEFSVRYGNAYNTIWHAGNDGSGSGLDADTLDGVQGSSFLRSDATDSFTGTITNSGEFHSFYDGNAPGTNLRLGRNADQYMTLHGGSSGNFMTSVSTTSNPKDAIKFGISVDNGATLSSVYTLNGSSGTIWHTGNDGSGSGLDADLWDGNQFADYLDQSVKTTSNPTWPSATLTGGLTLGTSITHQGDADTSIGFTTNQIVLQAGGVDALTANSTQLLSPLPLTVGNGTDQDYDLIVVNSSKAAKLYWDESATKIATNWGFYAAGDVRFNSYATIKTSLGVGPTVSVPPTEALEVAGNISVTGTVDGRDIATDGSTLDTLNSTALTTSTTFGGDVSGTYNAIVVANDSHTHDGRYYTESEINTKLTNGTVNKINNQTQNQSGNFHMFVNDGGGNIGMRWNSTTGGTNTLVENGIAYELQIDNDSTTGDFNILKGSTATNTAGETITWTRAFKIEGSDSELYAYDNKIWHAGNDGSGSGLDADTLDGLQATDFVRINSTSGNSNDYLHISRNSTNATLYVNNISTGDIARFFKGSASSSTSGTNQVTIANDGSITATGDINTTSDARVKDNIEIIENAVDKVKQIRGVTFNRTDKEDAEKRYAGVIAQEVQKVLPEVIGGDEDNLTVAYGNMIGLLIEAIKEQQKQIEELKGMIQ